MRGMYAPTQVPRYGKTVSGYRNMGFPQEDHDFNESAAFRAETDRGVGYIDHRAAARQSVPYARNTKNRDRTVENA